MNIGINDLDDDDILVGQSEGQQPQQEFVEPQNQGEDNFLAEYLQSKGISDPEKIKFEDENGNIEERNWNSLTKQEKFNILNTPLDVPEDDSNHLSEDEIALLNQIRQNNMTPTQYINSLIGEQKVVEPQYKIDDLSDDELFLLDLESRVGEISDDEAAQAIASAKQNEEFYKKQVDGIRKEYKEREDYQNQQEQAQLEQAQLEAFQQYQGNVINAIDNFNSVGNLDLNFEDSDKEELAEFMLSQDETGTNYLYQALQDPQTLVKAAWFILNGDEAFNSVSDYFTNQIKLVSESQYKKGFEDGKKGTSSRPTVVIDKNPRTPKRTITDLNQLDDDED